MSDGHASYRRPYDTEEQVAELLKASGRPMGAYEISSAISANDRPIAPMQVYRTLERLIAARRVRRIEHLSAYVPEGAGFDMFAICDACGRQIGLALGGIPEAITSALSSEGFACDARS